MKKVTSLSDKGFEKLLRSVISEAESREISGYQADTAEVSFSPEYYERKTVILNAGAKREHSYNRRRNVRRTLLAACILMLSFFALAMTSKPIREAFKNMFVNVFGEYWEVGVIPDPPAGDDTAEIPPTDTEIPTYMMEYYAPSTTPQWVTSQRSSRLKEYERIYYLQDKKISATFFQRLLSEKPTLSPEEYAISVVDINGCNGELGVSLSDEKLILVWDDGRYSYELNGSLDPETAISMAKSLKRTYDWPTVLLEFYAPEYVPEGYTVTEEYKDIGGVTIIFESYENLSISFEQDVLSTDTNIDSTDVEVYGVTINGREATVILQTDNAVSILLWDDGRYRYTLIGDVPPETLILMAESLKPF